jgi:2-methylisocitrate lyase-like PEP mutase family enzyme
LQDQVSRAQAFTKLHVKGDPIIIYNAWDGGSARAIEEAGAKAIATGDHPVGFSHGYTNDDFDDFSFETYLGSIKDIARVVTVPFSVDISNGDGLSTQELQRRVATLLELGVIGINFEDRKDNGEFWSVSEQAERIATIREAADNYGVPLFINSRSDIFAAAKPDEHADLLDEAVARAEAYQAAGASGFFVPGLMDIDLIKQLTDRVMLPVNIIRLPGAPSTAELKEAGVSRVSYGPVVQMQMIDWLKDQAKQALNGEI